MINLKQKYANYGIYVDSFRDPLDSFMQTSNKEYKQSPWKVVRSFEEFTLTIGSRGIPEYISWSQLWDKDAHKSELDFAVWLVEYCRLHKAPFPKYMFHDPDSKITDQLLGVMIEYITEYDRQYAPRPAVMFRNHYTPRLHFENKDEKHEF